MYVRNLSRMSARNVGNPHVFCVYFGVLEACEMTEEVKVGDTIDISHIQEESKRTRINIQQWISIKDRLPELCDKVIVWSDKLNESYMCQFIGPGNYPPVMNECFIIGNDRPGRWDTSLNDVIELTDEIYWMPIQEPPK